MKDENYVYHGSPTRSFEVVTPKRNIRSRLKETGEREVTFDELSFHATPYKWIGLAYTYRSDQDCMMGVDLYEHQKKIAIYSHESLEKSLEKMYGQGGYLYIFDKAKFFHKQGLGNLEVITKEALKPLSIERIDDPVKELKALGVEFEYFDLAKPENAALFSFA